LAAAVEIDAEQVNKAIDRGVAYLKREQNSSGGWAEYVGYPGGTNAMATLALLSSGVPVDDPVIQKALKPLRSMKLGAVSKTYIVALQTMVLCAAEPEKDQVLIRKNVDWLEKNQIKGNVQNGSWSYPGTEGDNSNSQFALLALHEAERVGIEVSDQTWKRAYDYWRRPGVQNQDGSWGYQPHQPGTGSMTCAGIAALIITAGKVSGGDANIEAGVEQCCGRGEEDDELRRGLAWLGEHIDTRFNPAGGELRDVWHFYYLYGLERAGRLSSRRFFGKDYDWYRQGAEVLLAKQDPLSGFWRGPRGPETNPVLGTSYALLFLSKGRRPVVVGKLEYGTTSDWNNHRQDLAQLTTFTETQWKRDLTWQVIDITNATVEDLLTAPVIYIGGQNDPEALVDRARLLREYVNRGGFLFAEPSCRDGAAFDRGFRQLMQLVFPEQEYRLRDLPAPDHAIWRTEIPVLAKYARKLEGIDYGCRTCVVYCPIDLSNQHLQSLSCYWELAGSGRDAQPPENIQQRIESSLAIGVNVLTYATNREPKYKNPTQRLLDKNVTKVTDARSTLYIAKLEHNGGCNAAPAALVNLLRAASKELELNVSDEERMISPEEEALFRHHLVFMHGRHKFQFSTQERKQLAEYLKRGGMIMADAICASREFTESFRHEIEEITKLMKDVPDVGRLARIDVHDPLFTTEYGGYDIRRVKRRDPAARVRGEPLRAKTRETAPDLEGLKIGEHYGVIFSPYDISCALEKQVSLECDGYTPEDAARIGLNILLYSLHK
jgi:hypothetical protein